MSAKGQIFDLWLIETPYVNTQSVKLRQTLLAP